MKLKKKNLCNTENSVAVILFCGTWEETGA